MNMIYMDEHDLDEEHLSFPRQTPVNHGHQICYPALLGADVLTRQSRGDASRISTASVSLRRFAGHNRKTALWWAGLCTVALFNIGAWLVVAWAARPYTEYRSWQLLLSGVYVSGCAFRSVFPRVDLERLCLWDTSCSAI